MSVSESKGMVGGAAATEYQSFELRYFAGTADPIRLKVNTKCLPLRLSEALKQ